MPLEREISELPVLSAITGTNILHTKDTGTSVDSTMTVQQVLDLAPAADQQPADAVLDTGVDSIVFADGSDSNRLKRESWADFLSLIGAATVTGTVASGAFSIGPIHFRIGNVVSNSNSAQVFNFASSFTTACSGVWLNLQSADASSPMPALSWTTSGFTIDRTNAYLSTVHTVNYLAIGY